MKLKLTHFVAIVLCLTTILSTAAFGALTYRSSRASLIAAQGDKLKAVATAQRESVERTFAAWVHHLKLITSQSRLRTVLSMVGADELNNASILLENTMLETLQADHEIKSFSILSLDGTVIAKTGEPQRPPNAWLETGAAEYVSGVTLLGMAPDSHGAHIALSIPVADYANRAFVAVFEVSLEELTSVASNYNGLGATGETVIARRLIDGSAQFIVPLRHEKNAAFTHEVPFDRTDSPIVQALYGSEQIITSGIVDYREKPVLAATQYIPLLDLALLTKIDRAEALAPSDALLRNWLLVGGMIVLMSFALSIVISRKILAPVDKLTKAARKIRHGEHDVTAEPSAIAEFDTLARTFNLMTQTLTDARHEAEAASRLKSEFLANMSHEIRTPLNGVLGMAQLLERTELGPKQAKYSKTIRSCGEALLAIISDVLDISKIESGLMKLNEAPFELDELLEHAEDAVAGNAMLKGLTIKRERPLDGPTRFVGDEKRLLQVLINFAGNAVKFSSKGQITLSVKRLERGCLRFSVTDSGPGVAEQQQARIFQRFTQVDGSLTRDYGGTGLGLAISKELIELMQGEIGVESVLGEGATFWFSVPLSPASDDAAETNAVSTPLPVDAASAELQPL